MYCEFIVTHSLSGHLLYNKPLAESAIKLDSHSGP